MEFHDVNKVEKDRLKIKIAFKSKTEEWELKFKLHHEREHCFNAFYATVESRLKIQNQAERYIGGNRDLDQPLPTDVKKLLEDKHKRQIFLKYLYSDHRPRGPTEDQYNQWVNLIKHLNKVFERQMDAAGAADMIIICESLKLRREVPLDVGVGVWAEDEANFIYLNVSEMVAEWSENFRQEVLRAFGENSLREQRGSRPLEYYLKPANAKATTQFVISTLGTVIHRLNDNGLGVYSKDAYDLILKGEMGKIANERIIKFRSGELEWDDPSQPLLLDMAEKALTPDTKRRLMQRLQGP